MNYYELKNELILFREKLESSFSKETSLYNEECEIKSSGHCAIVSYILHKQINAEMMSTIIDNKSHWFNSIKLDEGVVQFDLTADQFGYNKVRIRFGELYNNSKTRNESELNEETLNRVKILESKIK